MEQRISLITLASRDLDATRHFYVDGLGWTPEFEAPGEVIMFKAGEHLLLSLWDAAAFAAEVGSVTWGEGAPPVTIAHNVRTREEVDQVITLAATSGATVALAKDRVWGGYSGYFADPDGFQWEVAWNPGPLGELVLP